jgi:RimJ/RimL family protein N-acetyltransferase
LDGRVVGWDGLEYLPETSENKVAYLLSHRGWGCGYATEVARAAVIYGFETAGLQAIIGLVHPGNTGSIRVLEKCGLTLINRKTYRGLEMCRYRIESRNQIKGYDPSSGSD